MHLIVRARRQARRLDAALSDASRRAEEMDRFRAITRALLLGHEPAGILSTVAQAAADLTGAACGHISLLTSDGRDLTLAASTGELAKLVGRTLPRAGSMAGWVIEHGTPLLIDDLAADPRGYSAVNQELGLVRGVMVPLHSRGKVVGALGADGRADSRPFSDHDVELLGRLGEQAVLATENAELFEASRRARAALSAKNRQLEQATVHKSAFLANMSHELRTQLNAIIGFSELVASGAGGALTELQADYLSTVVRNSRHLLGLINDLLDLSKVEAGKMELHLTEIDLRRVIDEVIRDLDTLITKQQQTVTRDIDEDSLLALVDDVRVRQVLFNLLSNAVKFTPDGGEISVRALRTKAPLPVPAQRAGDDAPLRPRDAIWVAIGDTGPGIKPEDMSKLFLEFSQVDASFSRRSRGTGLGLAVCKRFVELHGGSIGAESLPGHGSTFWFMLPVEGPVRHAASRPAQPVIMTP